MKDQESEQSLPLLEVVFVFHSLLILVPSTKALNQTDANFQKSETKSKEKKPRFATPSISSKNKSDGKSKHKGFLKSTKKLKVTQSYDTKKLKEEITKGKPLEIPEENNPIISHKSEVSLMKSEFITEIPDQAEKFENAQNQTEEYEEEINYDEDFEKASSEKIESEDELEKPIVEQNDSKLKFTLPF